MLIKGQLMNRTHETLHLLNRIFLHTHRLCGEVGSEEEILCDSSQLLTEGHAGSGQQLLALAR